METKKKSNEARSSLKNNDGWTEGLVVDGDRLKEYLAETPVLAAIQSAGEHLQHARAMTLELIANNVTKAEDMDVSTADELCEAFSRYARTPAMRFYNGGIIMGKPVMAAIEKRSPENFGDLPWTDAQFHAVITVSLMYQIMSMSNSSDEIVGEVVRCMEACIKARPLEASTHVMFGNFLMVNGFTQDAREELEKAVEMDEETCFGTFYTLGNIYQNAVNVEKANAAGPMEQLQAQTFIYTCCKYLRRYLDLAPHGHWHVHRACMSLILFNGASLAEGTEGIASIEKRNPGFCAESHAWFQRGVQALRLYENCYGAEQNDFKKQYKQAAGMISTMQKEGLLQGITITDEIPGVVESDYICAFPGCTTCHQSDAPLLKCSRCLSVRYCSKDCQIKHWKSGHKHECKKLAADTQARQAANPNTLKRLSVKNKQIGDD
jgi:hypothetical protein